MLIYWLARLKKVVGKAKSITDKMRVVIDTNIVFSAILNTNSLIAHIILHPKSRIHFYSTDLLLIEIQDHKNKLKLLSGFSDADLTKTISIVTNKIRFINAELIPLNILISTQKNLKDIDIDDTEFVALTSHPHGKLWSGDKVLQKGL